MWDRFQNKEFVPKCSHTNKLPLVYDYSGLGSRLNMKMSFYPYRDSRYKDKTVSRSHYLHNENSHNWAVFI